MCIFVYVSVCMYVVAMRVHVHVAYMTYASTPYSLLIIVIVYWIDHMTHLYWSHDLLYQLCDFVVIT